MIRMIQKYLPAHPANVAMHSPHDYDLTPGTMNSFQLECLMFVVGVFMQWILEVAGAGGAFWGMSEVWGWRGYSQGDKAQETNDRLRYVCNIVFGLACIRMLEKYVPENDHHQAMLSPQDWLMGRVNMGLGGRKRKGGDSQRGTVNAEEQM